MSAIPQYIRPRGVGADPPSRTLLAMSLLGSVGASTVDALAYLAAMVGFPVRVVGRWLSSPFEGGNAVRDEVLRQLYYTGIEAVSVTASIAFALGAVAMAQILSLVSTANTEAVVAPVICLLVIREIGPILTAIIVIARSGAAITVDVGNLVLRGEVELLDGLGVDPYRWLAWPRLVGVTVACTVLGAAFDVFAICGGYASIWLMSDLSLATLLHVLDVALAPIDVIVGIGKCAVFGLIIGTVSTWQGLHVGRSALEVPKATRRSVVHSLLACAALDAAATLVSWWASR
jgi:phospholipid/cholesterol/gamma-HCH transport system permease protein